MSIQLVCACGHVLRLASRPPGETIDCPGCHRPIPLPDVATPKPLKPLWEMMGRPPPAVQPADTELVEGSAAPEPDEPARDEPVSDEPGDKQSAPRGLWALMGAAGTSGAGPTRSSPPPMANPREEAPRHFAKEDKSREAATSKPTTSESAQQDTRDGPRAPETPPDAPRGLWALMGAAPPAVAPPPQPEVAPRVAPPPAPTAPAHAPARPYHTGRQVPAVPPPANVAPTVETPTADEVLESESLEPELDLPALEPESIAEALGVADLPAGRSRKAVVSLVLGLIAIPLASLALIPSQWTKVPATIAGFTSLMYALLAVNEIKQSRGRQTGMAWALAGMLAGVVGMLLAPTLIARTGKRWQRESTRQYTESHLTHIGQALNRYHDEHGAFPSGGVFRKQPPPERELRLHGWMTALLPNLGEQSLFQQIDQNAPFDAPVNFPAMSTDLPVFFAAGSDRAKIGGLGVAHFAGVGGEVVDDEGGYAQAGIFGVNSHVTRDIVVDGLSQTLAVGQIAENFPAWGEPENWRTIGRGLNRDVQGFGNSTNTGASFLMADGSVRFFSNKVDPRILLRMSTRDGGEKTEDKAPPVGVQP